MIIIQPYYNFILSIFYNIQFKTIGTDSTSGLLHYAEQLMFNDIRRIPLWKPIAIDYVE
jgi:hypothetical protein